jgi:DNA sulfur modification protein DndD
MILNSLDLHNFRQFYGTQGIQLAPPGDRNVTLIHAENGVGKTTLLNAVLWALFEDTTKGFEQKQSILNFEAQREGASKASVTLVFTHEGSDYSVTRERHTTSSGHSSTSFRVQRIEPNGSYGPLLPNPASFINTVIPRAMAPYFFFDGERAESFAAETSHKEVAAAIRDILGCTLIETAIGDLKLVYRDFNREIGTLPGQDRLHELEERVERAEDERDRHLDEITRLTSEIDATSTQLDEVRAKLRDAQAAAALENERRAYEAQLIQTQADIADAETDVLRWIASKGIAAVARSLVNDSLSFIDEESLRGRIPSPYNQEFVQGILTAQRCVCGRAVSPGSEEWHAVHELLRDAASAEVLGRIVRARARSEVLREARDDAGRTLELAERRVTDLRSRQRELEIRIAEVGKKLETLPVAEIQARERARRELDSRLDELKRHKARYERDVEHTEALLKDLNQQVKELAAQNRHARRLVTRRDLAERASQALQGILERYEKEARQKVQQEINTILDRTAKRHYRMDIDSSFRLRLLLADGTLAPKSQGENQLTGLAFIAALVQFARERAEQATPHVLVIPATVAPLVLDSPFGQLDEAYRAATAEFVPLMAPQVVLLVSSSQIKGPVIEAVKPRVGAEYVLIAENRGPQGGKRSDIFDTGSRRIPTVLFGKPRNLTRIERVG